MRHLTELIAINGHLFSSAASQKLASRWGCYAEQGYPVSQVTSEISATASLSHYQYLKQMNP